ncbi:MAG TPA: c-type cytochrome [Thermoanaerobaculia bacterium]|nr:c-type cytochrome [Thermoanaerobaculia bacterium]
MRSLLVVVSLLAVPLLGQEALTPQQHLEALRESIKGRENEPATAVFKNVQTLKRVTAGGLLNIMQGGFSRSLGVTCEHCHVAGVWEDDSKEAKRITREMSVMVRRINTELLPAIEGMKEEKPIVNCTTCHRGQIKPATDMP